MSGRFGVEAQRARFAERRAKIDLDEKRLDANEDKKLTESADESYDRLARFSTRQGLQEVRVTLTGDRRKVVYIGLDVPDQAKLREIAELIKKHKRDGNKYEIAPDAPDKKKLEKLVKAAERIATYKEQGTEFEIGTAPLKVAIDSLLRDACGDSPCVAISQVEIAAKVGYSERHVRRALDELESEHLLYRIKRPGAEALYLPLLPESERYAEEFECTLYLWRERLGRRLQDGYQRPAEWAPKAVATAA